MQHNHVKSMPLGGITVVAVAKDALAAINEGTCWSGPPPLVAEVLDEFVQALAAAPGPVVIDIRDTQSLDHASVFVVFRLAKLVADRKKGGLLCCSGELKETLEVCGLNRVCPSVTTLEEAMTALAGWVDSAGSTHA